MAALTCLAASAGLAFLLAATTALAVGPPPAKQKVLLKVRLVGTAPGSGVELVIRPGNPTCRFKEITYPVRGDGDILDILPIEVETVNADRDCSFAIVLKEPGQSDRTFRRSLQINAAEVAANPDKPQVLVCYLNSRGAASRVAPGVSSQPIATKPAPAPATRKR